MKLITFLMLIPVLLAGCSPDTRPPEQVPPTAKAALVKSVRQDVTQTIRATGTLHAKETATISAQTSGVIRQVLVQAGDQVRAGQLLATLDAGEMRAAFERAVAARLAIAKQQAAAGANARLAAETLARYRILKTQKSVSPQEFAEVETRSEAAKLQVEELAAESVEAQAAVAGARTRLAYTTLRAPFAGLVTARLADPGTLASPGLPLLQIDRAGPLQVYTTVDESRIAAVHLGMKVPVAVGSSGAGAIWGTVAQIIPAADPESRTFLAKLDLPRTADLRSGMFATADFPGPSREAVLAPQSAMVERGSLAWVYALDARGIAHLRYVVLGRHHGNLVEVLSGLPGGETLVNDPGDRDLGGRRIEALP